MDIQVTLYQKNQFTQYQLTDDRFYTIKEDEIDSSESIAKDTGLLWLYDAASPTENIVDSFSTHAQVSMKNDEDVETLEYKMNNVELNDTNMHISSNSLQGYNIDNAKHLTVPRYHINSSQSVNNTVHYQHYFQPWEVPIVNRQVEPSEGSTTLSSFTSISSVPKGFPKSIVFDFEMNEELKLSQVQSNYFIDADTAEIVYFCPLAEQVVTYNFNCIFKWKIGSININSNSAHEQLTASRDLLGNKGSQINPYTSQADNQLSSFAHPFSVPQEYTRNESINFKAPRQTLSSLGTQYSTLEGKS